MRKWVIWSTTIGRWVDTRKNGGVWGAGAHEGALKVEEEGSSPPTKSPKKEPSHRGPTGGVPVPTRPLR